MWNSVNVFSLVGDEKIVDGLAVSSRELFYFDSAQCI